MTHIMMPVRTVADWGGVHEWTVDATRALTARGHRVTVVGAGKLFAARAEEAGAEFIEIDWSDLPKAAEITLERIGDVSLLFAHAPHARMLALELRARTGIPVNVMIHGSYHDSMFDWSDQVDVFMAASPALMYFVQHIGKVEPWKCALVANGVADEVFDIPLLDIDAKLEQGTGTIVTASRLAPDKTSQIAAVAETLRACVSAYPSVDWKLEVYGDGPLRDYFEGSYRMLCQEIGAGSLNMNGWVSPQDIPTILSESVVSVMAGMGGVRSIAAGTLTIGAGARDNLGVQAGANLRAGIYSNFGDHGCPRFKPSSIRDDLADLLTPGAYREVLELNREILRRTNSQSAVDAQMLSALQLH